MSGSLEGRAGGADAKVSIIATTYNQSVDLGLYLKSLTLQSRQDFEVVVADDGSDDESAQVIEAYKKGFFGDRLFRVTHEHLGYRKAKIVNAAVRASRGTWLIFTDSDLIVHPRFVEDHVSNRAENALFMGRRVDLGSEASEWVREHSEQMFSGRFYYQILRSFLVGGGKSRGFKRAFRTGSGVLSRLLRMDRVPDLLGSNFSIDRGLLYRVNGFDESREHYWGEDGDLFVRARNAGAQVSGRKGFAVQFHLWHPLRKPPENAEADYRARLNDRSYTKCQAGINST